MLSKKQLSEILIWKNIRNPCTFISLLIFAKLLSNI